MLISPNTEMTLFKHLYQFQKPHVAQYFLYFLFTDLYTVWFHEECVIVRVLYLCHIFN